MRAGEGGFRTDQAGMLHAQTGWTGFDGLGRLGYDHHC